MTAEPLQKIEELLLSYTQAVARLRAEAGSLRAENSALKSELEKIRAAFNGQQAELVKITHLQHVNREMEKERVLLRSKVQTILGNLENTDLF